MRPKGALRKQCALQSGYVICIFAPLNDGWCVNTYFSELSSIIAEPHFDGRVGMWEVHRLDFCVPLLYTDNRLTVRKLEFV